MIVENINENNIVSVTKDLITEKHMLMKRLKSANTNLLNCTTKADRSRLLKEQNALYDKLSNISDDVIKIIDIAAGYDDKAILDQVREALYQK